MRLWILSLSTCVGLRYGHPGNLPEVFLGSQNRPVGLSEDALPRNSRIPGPGFAWVPILRNGRPLPAGRRLICLRHPITRTLPRWCRNVDLLPIDYAFRPRLRVRLTQGGLTFPRKPWISGVQGSHLDGVTHAGRVTSMRSIGPHGPTSTPMERSSTNAKKWHSAASVTDLSPVELSARSRSTSELLRFL